MLVELTYFKKTGKYYTNTDYMTDETELDDIYYEVSRKIKNNKLPGLVNGASNFIVLVNVPSFSGSMKLLNLLSEDDGINIGGNASGTFVRGNGNIVNS